MEKWLRIAHGLECAGGCLVLGFCLVADSAMESWGVVKFCWVSVAVLAMVWVLIGVGQWIEKATFDGRTSKAAKVEKKTADSVVFLSPSVTEFDNFFKEKDRWKQKV